MARPPRWITAFLFAICLTSNLFGQIQHSASTVKILSGVEVLGTYGDTILVSDASDPKVVAAGRIKIESEASNVTVRASNLKREPVEVVKLDATSYLIKSTGQIWVDIFAVDFAKNIFNVEQIVITIDGPSPQPDNPDGPDVPTPDVPDDAFDNIGKRVVGWSAGLPKRKEVAAIYRDAAKQLSENPAATVNSVSAEIVAKRIALLGVEVDKYKDLVAKLNAELNARWPMSKGTLANFFSAIANGLEAGQ